MMWSKRAGMGLILTAALLLPAALAAQDMPVEYKAVLTALGKGGDFKDGVLKVNIPRNDLQVTIGQRPAPTPFGFGGWIALTISSRNSRGSSTCTYTAPAVPPT